MQLMDYSDACPDGKESRSDANQDNHQDNAGL